MNPIGCERACRKSTTRSWKVVHGNIRRPVTRKTRRRKWPTVICGSIPDWHSSTRRFSAVGRILSDILGSSPLTTFRAQGTSIKSRVATSCVSNSLATHYWSLIRINGGCVQCLRGTGLYPFMPFAFRSFVAPTQPNRFVDHFHRQFSSLYKTPPYPLFDTN